MSERETSGMNGPTLKPWSDEDEAAWQELHGSAPVPPPSDDVLEQKLLGALLTNDPRLPHDLRPREFVDPVHGLIYEAIQRCNAVGQLVSPTNVAGWLEDEPRMEEVGGTAYLIQLVSEAHCLPPICVESAAEKVSELAHARDLLTHLDALSQLVSVHAEMIHDPDGHGRGGGRSRAHALAMDLTGLARDVLDRSLGWA